MFCEFTTPTETSKMQSLIKLVVCGTIFVALIPHGLCIKCWSCSSSYDPKCGNPFDNSTLPITDCNLVKDSPHSPGLCSKISRKVNGSWTYTRDCAHLDEGQYNIREERFCVTKTESDGTITEHCTCNNKDGCNSSFNFTPTKMLLYSLVFLTIVMKNIAL